MNRRLLFQPTVAVRVINPVWVGEKPLPDIATRFAKPTAAWDEVRPVQIPLLQIFLSLVFFSIPNQWHYLSGECSELLRATFELFSLVSCSISQKYR